MISTPSNKVPRNCAITYAHHCSYLQVTEVVQSKQIDGEGWNLEVIGPIMHIYNHYITNFRRNAGTMISQENCYVDILAMSVGKQ